MFLKNDPIKQHKFNNDCVSRTLRFEVDLMQMLIFCVIYAICEYFCVFWTLCIVMGYGIEW